MTIPSINFPLYIVVESGTYLVCVYCCELGAPKRWLVVSLRAEAITECAGSSMHWLSEMQSAHPRAFDSYSHRHRDLGMHPEACYRGMCGCAGHARYAPKQTSCLAFIRTSVSHNSLKSSPISLILLYLSSSRQCQNAHTICRETLWLFYMAISCRTKQLSTHNFFISTCNYIKQLVKWSTS